ncbi:MarR family transcriptional regulator [Klebsiella variicola subsp. variicola]|nr:MarR family transcriptional regulator [Klebsiella variicola subsp. variicola]
MTTIEQHHKSSSLIEKNSKKATAKTFSHEYDTFCILLQRAARLWRREANLELRDFRLSESITGPIWAISKFGAMRQKELAEHIGVEGNSLVRIIDELEKEGLVIRRSMPTDRRARIIDLTAAGRRVAVELEDVLRGFIADLLSTSSSEEVEVAQRVLTAIIDQATERSKKD